MSGLEPRSWGFFTQCWLQLLKKHSCSANQALTVSATWKAWEVKQNCSPPPPVLSCHTGIMPIPPCQAWGLGRRELVRVGKAKKKNPTIQQKAGVMFWGLPKVAGVLHVQPSWQSLQRQAGKMWQGTKRKRCSNHRLGCPWQERRRREVH